MKTIYELITPFASGASTRYFFENKDDAKLFLSKIETSGSQSSPYIQQINVIQPEDIKDNKK